MESSVPPSSEPRAKQLSRGRPRVHNEDWIKVSVVLFTRQVRDLDRLTEQIRRKTGASLTRAELIRSLIDALSESRLDVTHSPTAVDLKRLLVAQLCHGRPLTRARRRRAAI